MTAPRLSAVLWTPDRFEVVRCTVDALVRQSMAPEMELVVVAPCAADLGIDVGTIDGFAAVRVVEVGPFHRTSTAQAEGARAASADFVVFCEEHCWPAEDWAEALVTRLERGASVVAPVFRNPNPGTALSWANFVIEYGPWMEGVAGGSRAHLPGNNSAYRRDVLMAHDGALEELLDAESVLHWRLASEGHELVLEPRARVSHLNISEPRAFVDVSFHTGWLFAGARARAWPWWRRLVYAAGSPLIPLVRLHRLAADVRAAGLGGRLARMLPALLLGLGAGAAGECLGYLGESEHARRRIHSFEFGRRSHLAAGDPFLDQSWGARG